MVVNFSYIKFAIAIFFVSLTFNACKTSNSEEFELEPDPFVVTECDSEPQFDYTDLSKLLIYPPEARRYGIEGDVIVRTLINSKGRAEKVILEYASDSIFVEPTYVAILNYKNYKPAVKGNKKIKCWTSIPVKYKLKTK